MGRQARGGPEVRPRIERLIDEGKTNAEILDQIEQSFGEDAANEKTVRRIRKERAGAAPQSAWSIAHATADEAGYVPAVLAVVIARTHGERTSVTNEEARFIAKIAAAASDLEPFDIYRLARDYTASSQRKIAGWPEALDHYLAFAPWRGQEQERRYITAMLAGWIPQLHNVDMDQVIAMQKAELAKLAPAKKSGRSKRGKTRK